MKNFTKSISQEMIQKAKNNFYKSNAPKSWKTILKSLKINVILNKKFSSTAGRMSFIEYYSGMPFKDLTVFEGSLGKWFIELNPKVVVNDSYYEILDLISHELAHTLDFLVNEKSYRHFHNDNWKYIHKCMGGTTDQFYNKLYYLYNRKNLQTLLRTYQND